MPTPATAPPPATRALELVLAGRARPPQQPGVRTEPAPDLPALLGGAAALVHPALHEGFGLTPLEAMHAGVPVIAARSPGLAETCADAALYVDPYDAEGSGAPAAPRGLRPGAARRPRRTRARARRGVLLAGLGARPHRGLYAGSDDGRPPQLRRTPPRLVKVAILGTRGIPASYSGFETAAEQLASRLTQRGHEVIVYCRPHVVDRRLKEHKGARLVHIPAVRNKYLDTFTHTLLSSLHCARRLRPDVALFFIAGNSPMCLVTRGAGIPTVINVDGLDSDRSKWPALAKAYLRFAERNAPRWSDTAITDSHAVAEIFEQRYGQRIGVVPYGVEDPGHVGTETLDRLGLEPGKYVLFVGRLEPENNPHVLVEAFSRISAERAKGMKLVVVGGAPYAHDYIKQVQRAGDPRVLFPGYVFGRGYWELQHHAYVFCAPTEVGGTHPVILEALAAGNCVLVNDHAPNVETVGDAGLTFEGKVGVPSLTAQLERLFDEPELVEHYRARARERARRYSWDAVTDEYEQLLVSVRQMGGPGALPAELVDGASHRARLVAGSANS